jgi:hypothetical protein
MTRPKNLTERVTRLEAWAEAVMQAIMSLDVEALLTELDEARGGYGDDPDEPGPAG